MKFSLLIIILIFCFVPTVAQTTFRLKNYLPDKIGLEWQFKNNVKDGLSPIIVKNSQKMAFGNIETVQRTENNGDYRLQSITNRGLEIYQLYFVGNRFIEYEKPIVLMPSNLKLGETYSSEIRYKTKVNQELKEQGTQRYKVKIERIENVETPLQTFKSCLVIRTIALRIDESGSQKGYELEEWYAKNIGAVRVVGTLFWKNSKGEITKTFKVDAALENLKK